jgi:hypothetical protein
VLGGGVADVGERTRPGDDREHGYGQRVGDHEQAAARATQEPSGPSRTAWRPSPARPASRRYRCARAELPR